MRICIIISEQANFQFINYPASLNYIGRYLRIEMYMSDIHFLIRSFASFIKRLVNFMM